MAVAMLPRFAFVGENRSNRAISMGVTWQDGRLAAKTLHEALRAADINPEHQYFTNAFHDGPTFELDTVALETVRQLAAQGTTVVALGQRVQRALRQAGIDHVSLTHPAARGRIRARALYQSHVASALLAVL